MPHNSSSTDQEATSSKSEVTNDSTRTERGSPVPDIPDVSEYKETSADIHNHESNIDQDLLGFGAQFDDKK
ncbi:hypothetical protein Daesc_005653 [Daldinia eschscholtzii]|uniref:Uncharacterized protein n=1 Tax=Daldinia eschscholtzii TaxID=292717 RepID=A0AAX6ML10_9PEZI